MIDKIRVKTKSGNNSIEIEVESDNLSEAKIQKILSMCLHNIPMSYSDLIKDDLEFKTEKWSNQSGRSTRKL